LQTTKQKSALSALFFGFIAKWLRLFVFLRGTHGKAGFAGHGIPRD